MYALAYSNLWCLKIVRKIIDKYMYIVRRPRQINHYENMPIQIYRIFHLQKLKIFR